MFTDFNPADEPFEAFDPCVACRNDGSTRSGGLLMALDDDIPSFMTVAEVARVFRIGRNTVYDLVRRGALDGTRIGHAIRIRRSAVERLLDPPTAVDEGRETSGVSK